MTKLTEKENYLMTLRGECPEWVPMFMLGSKQMPDMPPASVILVCPEFLSKHRTVGVGGIDPFGVEYVCSAEANGATMPKTRDFILTDIRKWRDVIKAPDVSGYDWEKIAKDAIKASGIDRSQSALSLDLHFGYFQNLMAFMGFTEGLCALYEEPEECKALMDYLCDFYCNICEHLIDYYDPDVITIKDDTASWLSPFMSLDIYEEIFLPQYDRQAKFGRDRGLPITFHNCGKCECFIDDMLSVGVNMWDPCQTCNDLVGIKKKYGNRLVLAGGWEARGHFLEESCTDDEIIASVEETIRTLGEGGGYCFGGGYFARPDDELAMHRNKVVHDTYERVGKTLYKH